MKVIYNHPAIPPVGIEVGKTYDAIESTDGNNYTVEGITFEKDIFIQLFKEIA